MKEIRCENEFCVYREKNSSTCCNIECIRKGVENCWAWRVAKESNLTEVVSTAVVRFPSAIFQLEINSG